MKIVISFVISAALLYGAPVIAQEKQQADYNTSRDFKNRIFRLQNRDARTIASAIQLLGSGFKGAGLSVNEELRTITVRDFPENLAAMEDAVKRLDQPVAQAPDMDMKVFVLIGSKTPLPDASVPDELAPVVRQLQSTLSYKHYGLMTTAIHRTKVGSGIEGSGVVEPTLLGMTAVQTRPIFYTYRLRRITPGRSGDQPSIDVENVEFSMRVPLDIGGGQIQYQSVGFETPVSMRQREKVVIGTTSMRDKALIVVITAEVDQ